ncbi:MAG: MFS transporter [Lachnospiraceae bacterium]|nr:MFS transporter [Lachnospiraceae bacterium]
MKFHYKYKTIMVGMAFLSINAFWQMYDNITPLILKNSFGLGETLIGLVMAVDNILALFLLPILGTYSDHIQTRLGKRIPFIIGGTVLADIAMFFMPIADNSRNLLLFLIMTGIVLLCMSLYRSPAVALMPDVTPKSLRSKGNAIINLAGAVGGIYALAMIKLLVKEGNTPNYFQLFVSIITLMLISVMIITLTVNENKWTEEARKFDELEGNNDDKPVNTKEDTIKNKIKGFYELSPDKKRSLLFLLMSVCLWYMAYNAVTTAFSRYATQVWNSANGSFANYLLVATVAAVVSYIPIGMISGLIGRKKTVLIGIVGLAIGFGACFFTKTPGVFTLVMFCLVGFSWAAINVNSLPMVVDIGNSNDIGKFTGLYYTFSMVGQILTPILSGALLELVSYKTLFPYAVVFSILAFFTMLQVKHGDIIPEKKRSLLEHFDVDD